ncbi:hypothetical protein HYQ46_012631 [Verticillium longisporum]|nr:hypothetical protein HYQ46_012631 [Verticillium longisporum]
MRINISLATAHHEAIRRSLLFHTFVLILSSEVHTWPVIPLPSPFGPQAHKVSSHLDHTILLFFSGTSSRRWRHALGPLGPILQICGYSAQSWSNLCVKFLTTSCISCVREPVPEVNYNALEVCLFWPVCPFPCMRCLPQSNIELVR